MSREDELFILKVEIPHHTLLFLEEAEGYLRLMPQTKRRAYILANAVGLLMDWSLLDQAGYTIIAEDQEENTYLFSVDGLRKGAKEAVCGGFVHFACSVETVDILADTGRRLKVHEYDEVVRMALMFTEVLVRSLLERKRLFAGRPDYFLLPENTFTPEFLNIFRYSTFQ